MRTSILACLLVLSITASAQRIDSIDLHILQKIALTRTPERTRFQHIISDANEYVNIAIPAGLLAGGIIGNDREMRLNALYVASTTASTALLNAGLKLIFKRPRPFKAFPGFTAVYTPNSYSFPSGHTSSAFSATTALSRAYPKWYVVAPSMLWAGAVGYSRMYLGVHNPSDVLAGAALGAGMTWGFDFIRRY